MSTRPRAIWSWLSLVILLLAACTNVSTPTAPPTAAGSTIDSISGGTLRVAMNLVDYESFQLDVIADPPRFNHAWDPSTTWAAEPFELFRCCLLRTLMSYNGHTTTEGGAELQPDLAADYPEISPDGLTWTFTLKDGLHYAPPMATVSITSHDVIRALERVLRPDPFAPPDQPQLFGPYASYLAEVIAGADEFGSGSVSSISGLEAPDDRTLVVHLVRPTGDLGARLALPAAAPLPPGAADGHDAGYGRYLVASGPYMIDGSTELDPSLPADQQPTVSGYVPGSSLTLVRNPSWDRSQDRLRAAYVDRIEISQMNDYEGEIQALLDDLVDVALHTDMDQVDIDRLRGDSAVASRIHVSPGLASDWIVMNLAAPPFDDLHVRRAVNLMVNKPDLMELIQPSARIQSHAIPDAFENGLLTDYKPYGTVDDAGSLAQAQAEMALSGYDSNGDGVCDAPSCSAIYVPVRNDEPEFGLAADSFAAQLAPLGLVLDVAKLDPGEAFGYWSDPTSHAQITFTLGWASDYLNASSWFGPLATSDAIGADWGANFSLVGATPSQLDTWGYPTTEVPSLDARIAGCSARTGQAQFQCWAEIDQYVMERVAAWIPLDNRQSTRLTSPSIDRFQFDASLTMPALDQITVVNHQ